jgi:hypothetical protein
VRLAVLSFREHSFQLNLLFVLELSMSEKSSEDTGLCTFSFADGRRCRSLAHTPASLYCLRHHRKLTHLKQTDDTAQKIIEPLANNFIPVSALTSSLVSLYHAVAQGRLSPKQASAMAKIANVLLKSISVSNTEFREVFVEGYWSQLVRDSYGELPDYTPNGASPSGTEDTEDEDDADDDSADENGDNTESSQPL